jgi:hypothetical protein
MIRCSTAIDGVNIEMPWRRDTQRQAASSAAACRGPPCPFVTTT